MNIEYDSADINYLVDHFNLCELRVQRHSCEVQMQVSESIGEDAKADQYRAMIPIFDLAINVAKTLQAERQPIAGYMDVEAVKARADIVSLAERYTSLRKSGKNFVGLCPIHGEKNPSFVIYPENQSFHCFGCQAHGDVISLVMAADHLDFKAALAVLGGERGH